LCDSRFNKSVSSPEKLRYVVDENGKGYWIKPKPPMPTDYEEDIDY
tara:strand:+ start:3391 stop:3528 length:138 start_codon:yes stop_codon:yes gene_type:complete